jgi:hypothetical protein
MQIVRRRSEEEGDDMDHKSLVDGYVSTIYIQLSVTQFISYSLHFVHSRLPLLLWRLSLIYMQMQYPTSNHACHVW